jgi:hypothetical protein
MNSTRSILVLLTLLVLGSAVWSVWKVLRIEPLELTNTTAPDEWERVPDDESGASSSALTDPDNELAEPTDTADSRSAAPVEDDPESDEPRSVAHTGPASVIKGIVIDEDTREPLPEFVLKLQDEAGVRIDVTTDAEGRFVTPVALAHGTIRIRPIDHPLRRSLPAPVVLAHPVTEGHEFEVTTRSGPTYRLAIEPTTVLASALEARLRVSGKNVRGSQDFDPVREGTPPWVRLPPLSGDVGEARGLEVRDRDGLWSGRAEVSRVRGSTREIVRVVLEPRVRLSGRVVDPRGQPIQHANVSMKMIAGESIGQERAAVTEADGTWRFTHLLGGTAQVSATAFRFEPQKDLRVVLVPRDAIEQTITLVPLPPAGRIRGRITSESGRYDVAAEAVLTSVDKTEATQPQRAEIVWSDSGNHRVGTFEFPDLPAGKYRVAGRTIGSWYELAPEWKPSSLFASPPDESLSYLILDNTARADLVLRVKDGDSGEDVKGMRGWFAIGKKDGRARDIDSGEVAISGFPYDQTLRWRVDKAGYQPAIGDAASFGVETRADGRVQRIAEVALVRGWGEYFRVSDADGKKSLAGARILLDEREVGVTDENGLVLVRANVPPKQVSAEYQDWTVRGRVDLSPATRRKNQYFNAITMTPPRKRR